MRPGASCRARPPVAEGCGGSARSRSPSLCVATAEDALRLFYRAPGVPSSHVKITVRVTSGVAAVDSTYEIAGDPGGWKLSDRIMLPDIRDASGQQTVTISFAQVGARVAWQIDDVEIDPWRSL
ncbi:MAG TPA: hypothetical protein VI248_10885 [Kineosporiaceae bacterium]